MKVLQAIPIGCFAVLAACEKVDAWRHPEAAACRKFVLAGLRSPSTFAEASRAFSERSGVEGRQFRTVSISYDAANAYGTPIRAMESCEFEVDAKGNFTRDPDTAAVLANADRALGREGSRSCCLPPLALKTDDLMANVTMGNVTPVANGFAK